MKMKKKIEDELLESSPNLTEASTQLEKLEELAAEYEQKRRKITQLKSGVEEQESTLRENTNNALIGVKEKMALLNQKVIGSKAKAQEVKELKTRLAKITEENERKDQEIERTKESLKETRKKIVITSDSEGVVKQFKLLSQKNKELQKVTTMLKE